MKRLLFSLVCTALCAFSVRAVSIYQYISATSGAPTSSSTRLSSATNLTAVGTTATTPCASGFSGISGFNTTFSITGPRIEFTLTAATGDVVSATQITAGLRRSTTGPDSCKFAYSTDGGTTWTISPQTYVPLNAGCATSIFGTSIAAWNFCATGSSIIFRIIPFNASGAGGTIQIWGLDVQGVVVSSTTPGPAVAASGPTTFCTGSNVVLSATPTGAGHTYQWYDGATLLTGRTGPNYTATTSGNYSVVMTGPVFCNYTSTPIAVTVLPPPTAPTISPSGSISICSFDSVVLSGPAGFTYQWRNGATNITGATNQTYTARTTGNYRLVIFNSSGCPATSTNSANITVRAAASSVVNASGSLSFCSGGNVTLSSAATGTGLTYQWYDGSTAMAGETASSYTATTSGTYSVRITTASGCTTVTNGQVVTEISTPVITASSATTFCLGGSTRLSVGIVTGATGITYQWKKDTVNIPGATGNSFIATSTGNYMIEVRVGSICTTRSNTIRVVAFPIPNPIVTFNGTRVSTQSGFVTYQWYLNTVTIPGATSTTTRVTSNGSYRVYVTDTNGCGKLSPELAVNTLSVNTLSGQDISIFPNPATSTIRITAPEMVRVVITNVQGKKELTSDSSGDIDISTLPIGLHIITILDEAGNRLLTEKLIKE
jgi:hypothetical protein